MARQRNPERPVGSGLEIHVLGPLAVTVDGAPLVVDTRKALAILALLAVERRAFAREELAALLWPDADDESARGALRRTLSVLRAALGDRWLRVDRSAVALDEPGVQVDLWLVEGAVRSDVEALRMAGELARGPFLAGFSLRDSPDFDNWRATRTTAVERTVANLLDGLVTAAEAQGDARGAIDAAARRVELDPLDEAAHRRLMGLLAGQGDRAGAIRQYRACVATLERELGVAPLAETTELYEAIRDRLLPVAPPHGPAPGPAPRPPRQPSREAHGPLPMVGRDRELADILELRRAASQGGRLALVTGEAGIGKSRLVDAVIETVTAERGLALVGRCHAAESGIPFGPIVELLRAGLARPDAADRLRRLPPRTLGELDRLVAVPGVGGPPAPHARDDTADRIRLVEAIADGLAALVAGDGPGLLAIEDLQWADDASRAVVAWMARRRAGRPLLLVLTWRPEDLDDAGQAFAGTLGDLPPDRHVEVPSLDVHDVAALVAEARDRGGPVVDPAALLVASDGLPLFVVEALRDAADEGAGTAARGVRSLIRDRLATVTETGGQVLAAASVLGRAFDAGLVRATSGRTEDETVAALEELVRRGLVREVADGGGLAFDFAHARFREVTYDGVSLARRRLLHRRAAEAIRAESHGRVDPAYLVQIAIHERDAGRDAEAAEAFREAAVAARSISALHEAERHLESALALGHPDVVTLLVALGEIRTAEGDYAGAIEALEAAAARSAEVELPSIEVRLGRAHARRGDLVTAASHLDAAIETLTGTNDGPPAADIERPSADDGNDRSTLVRALVERGWVASVDGDPGLAKRHAERARVLAEAAGDAAAASAAYRVLGLSARASGELGAAEVALRRSLDLAATDPDPGATVAAGNALALVVAERGDRDEAIALLEGALLACRRTGEIHLEAAVENNLADQLHAAGRQEEAMAHLKRAVALFADVGGRPGELEPEIWQLVAW